MNEVFIGIDLGTTGCKATVVNKRLEPVSDAYFEYDLITRPGGEVEQDASLWWELCVTAVRHAIKNAGIDPLLVRAISVSSQGISIVPVDDQGRTLRNAISWLDTRATDQTKRILSLKDEKDVFARTGKRLSPAYTLPKILWIKENEPEIYKKAYKFLFPHDYIVHKLCGEYVTDHTIASGSLMYDVEKKEWWADILNDFDISPDKLPELKWSGQVAGMITKDAAEKTGLSPKTIIAVGGQDQKCAALGAGIDEGIITVSLGTASAIEMLVKRGSTISDMQIPFFSYLFEDKYVMEGVVSTSGAALKWFRNLFCEKRSYADIDKSIVDDDKYSDVFFYPYLAGSGSPLWNNEAKGVFWGLSLDTGMTDLSRAVMEGIAYQIRANIEIMGKYTDETQEIRLFGGGGASDVWCEMICNICGKRTAALTNHETAGIGAAYLAGMAEGSFLRSNDNKPPVDTRKIFMPDKTKAEFYDKKYKRYMNIQTRLFSKETL